MPGFERQAAYDASPGAGDHIEGDYHCMSFSDTYLFERLLSILFFSLVQYRFYSAAFTSKWSTTLCCESGSPPKLVQRGASDTRDVLASTTADSPKDAGNPSCSPSCSAIAPITTTTLAGTQSAGYDTDTLQWPPSPPTGSAGA